MRGLAIEEIGVGLDAAGKFGGEFILFVWSRFISLIPTDLQAIPAETRRIAQAAFPKGNLYLHWRDELGPLYQDEAFASLFSLQGRPAELPGRLALITVFQFAEGLSDRAAAAAVQSRIDWKYALGLELTDAGFDASVLVEFRAACWPRSKPSFCLNYS